MTGQLAVAELETNLEATSRGPGNSMEELKSAKKAIRDKRDSNPPPLEYESTMTPRSVRFLLWKATATRLVKILHAFYGTQKLV